MRLSQLVPGAMLVYAKVRTQVKVMHIIKETLKKMNLLKKNTFSRTKEKVIPLVLSTQVPRMFTTI